MSSINYTCDLRLAATRALCDALDCSLINFKDETERNRIIKALLKTSASKEAEIKYAAFECLLSISSTCYEVLEPYMQAIFDLTINAVKCDEEVVAL
ncbi:hypothetical protein MRB53_003724 [Persea americana]|uniref:Uncharacterized protein n=1 Tax=Persea americana TaxID=3435 RepID=A0ACC2MYD6_PERAE|nr:hypothetical protein MRB53_003724 [Persea americana]